MFKDLKVESLTKQNLKEALTENLYWKKGLAPMPKSKAEWLVNNNRINDDDYVGVIGLEQGELIAFIYMIPDFLNVQDSENKVYWMISWWVHSNFKDTILGTYVFNEALNVTKKQIVIKSYAEGVTEFYEKQPFVVIAERNRSTIFFNLDTSVFLGKFPKFKKATFLVKFLDKISYQALKIINKRGLTKKIKSLEFSQVNEVDDQTWQFINPLVQNDLILKTKEYINWQLSKQQYTQINTGKLPYQFLQTGISPNINICNIKLLDGGNVVGFFSFVQNYNEINIKYLIAKNETVINDLIDLLVHYLYKVGAHYIFTDNEALVKIITQKFKTIFVYQVIKKGLKHNDLDIDVDNLSLTESDGHFY